MPLPPSHTPPLEHQPPPPVLYEVEHVYHMQEITVQGHRTQPLSMSDVPEREAWPTDNLPEHVLAHIRRAALRAYHSVMFYRPNLTLYITELRTQQRVRAALDAYMQKGLATQIVVSVQRVSNTLSTRRPDLVCTVSVCITTDPTHAETFSVAWWPESL